MNFNGKSSGGDKKKKAEKKEGKRPSEKSPSNGIPPSSPGEKEKSEELNRIKYYLESVPDIRMEKVKSIKAAISQGTYNMDLEKVAERLIEKAIRNALYSKKEYRA